MNEPAPLDLDAELDRLYQEPAATFVASRKTLVQALRRAGQGAAATEIERLQRPTPVAWLVNQLHFRSRDLLDALVDAGNALRVAVETGVDAEEFGARKRAHQDALKRAVDRAVAIVEEAGLAGGDSLRRKIDLTLNLLSASPEPVTPPPGRMATELEPVGFDALTSVAAPLPKLRAVPRLSGAEDAARVRVAAVKAAFDAAEKELRRLEQEAKVRAAAVDRATREVEDAERRVETTRLAREDARRELQDSTQRVEDARSALASARRQLGDVER